MSSANNNVPTKLSSCCSQSSPWVSASSSASSRYTKEQREDLVQISRNLRRLKRKFFLQAVQQQTISKEETVDNPVENLRNVLLSRIVDVEKNQGDTLQAVQQQTISKEATVDNPVDNLRNVLSRIVDLEKNQGDKSTATSSPTTHSISCSTSTATILTCSSGGSFKDDEDSLS